MAIPRQEIDQYAAEKLFGRLRSASLIDLDRCGTARCALSKFSDRRRRIARSRSDASLASKKCGGSIREPDFFDVDRRQQIVLESTSAGKALRTGTSIPRVSLRRSRALTHRGERKH